MCGSDNYRGVSSELREQATGVKKALFNLALSMPKKSAYLPSFGVVEVAGTQTVYEVAVARFSWNSSCAGVWLR